MAAERKNGLLRSVHTGRLRKCSVSFMFVVLHLFSSKQFEGHKSFLLVHWYPCFGLLVMSPHNGFLRFTSGVTSADLLSSFYVDSKKKIIHKDPICWLCRFCNRKFAVCTNPLSFVYIRMKAKPDIASRLGSQRIQFNVDTEQRHTINEKNSI